MSTALVVAGEVTEVVKVEWELVDDDDWWTSFGVGGGVGYWARFYFDEGWS